MMRPILMASAIALAAPAFAQVATTTEVDAMANTAGEVTVQPGDDMMDHSQHDMATPNASPTETTSEDVDGDPMNNTTSAEGTMANDTAATATTSGTVHTGVGGPIEAAADYPVCTRAITDNCLQTSRSPRPPAS